MKKKYNDNSDNFSDWTTKKLKEWAISLDDSIYGENSCYGSHDLQNLDGITRALEKRGIYAVSTLSFNK